MQTLCTTAINNYVHFACTLCALLCVHFVHLTYTPCTLYEGIVYTRNIHSWFITYTLYMFNWYIVWPCIFFEWWGRFGSRVYSFPHLWVAIYRFTWSHRGERQECRWFLSSLASASVSPVKNMSVSYSHLNYRLPISGSVATVVSGATQRVLGSSQVQCFLPGIHIFLGHVAVLVRWLVIVASHVKLHPDGLIDDSCFLFLFYQRFILYTLYTLLAFFHLVNVICWGLGTGWIWSIIWHRGQVSTPACRKSIQASWIPGVLLDICWRLILQWFLTIDSYLRIARL